MVIGSGDDYNRPDLSGRLKLLSNQSLEHFKASHDLGWGVVATKEYSFVVLRRKYRKRAARRCRLSPQRGVRFPPGCNLTHSAGYDSRMCQELPRGLK